MTYDEIINATKASLDRRDSRRNELAAKIEKVADAALDAARKTTIDLGGAGKIGRRRLYATCSQWANGAYAKQNDEVCTVLLTGVLTDAPSGRVRSLSLVDLSFFDGHNQQHQQGRACDDKTNTEVYPATVAELRAAAKALPAAVAALLTAAQEKAESEAAEADEAAAGLEA
jgi:hypothetical protein